MKFKLSDFSRKVLTVLAGNALAQIVFLIGAAFLPRWYGPESFGEFAVFLSALNVLMVLFPLRYDLMLPLPREEGTFRAAFLLALVLSSFFMLLGLTLSPLLALFQERYSLLFFLFLFLASFLAAVGNSYQFALIRWERFQELTRSKVWMAVGITFCQGVLFYFFPDSGLILGYALGLLWLLAYLLPRGPAFRKPTIPVHQLKAVAREYFPIVKFSLPSGLLNTLAVNIQPLLLTAVFGPLEAGFFFLAYRLVGSPLNLLTSAVSQVYYPNIVKRLAQAPQSALPFTLQLFWTVAGVVVIPFLLVYFGGVFFFSWLLGPEYAAVGQYAAWMIPFFFGKALLNPISSLAETLKETRAELIFNLLLLLLALGCIALGKWQGAVRWFILPYSLSAGLTYLGLLAYYLRRMSRLAAS